MFETTDDNALLGRWSDADVDDEDDEEKEEPLIPLDVENTRNVTSSLRSSERSSEKRPSMATIEEADFSETLRDEFEDDPGNQPKTMP